MRMNLYIIYGLFIVICFFAVITGLQLKLVSTKPTPLLEIGGLTPLHQYPELPTGCEAVATTMLLKWADLDVTKEEVAALLPKGMAPIEIDGTLIGANPHTAFVGSPFSTEGYGVFHEPIASLIDEYLPHLALDLTGCSFLELYTILDTGRPIILWVTIDMKKPKVSKHWLDPSGANVIWKTPEHAILTVGYTKNHLIALDPHTGKKEYYHKKDIKRIWIDMGRQAVTLKYNTHLTSSDSMKQ